MFLRKIPALLNQCEPSVMAISTSAVWAAKAESRALEALMRTPTNMGLQQRIQRPREWRRIQECRREDLEALLIADVTRERRMRICDLLCEICEEADWSDPESGAHMQDMTHPVIDAQCAQTACLIGWTAVYFSATADVAESSELTGRLLHEVRRRVFTPILSHEDYPFMRGKSGSVGILSAVMTAVIFLENDVSRRNATLRRLARLLDDACANLDSCEASMAETVSDVCAATDVAEIMYRVSHGAADLHDYVPSDSWLDAILAAHAGGALFFDPLGDGMQCGISGLDVYRLGTFAGDDDLMILGASLDRLTGLPSDSVNGRMLSLELAQGMSGELRHTPKLSHAHTPKMCITSEDGFLCGLYLCGNRGNVGDVVMMLDGKPLFADGGAACSVRNLPVICGQPPVRRALRPEADWEFTKERDMLSVDLRDAYPASSALKAYQRTLLTDHVHACIRLIDNIELHAPGTVRFRFLTAIHPQMARDGMGLGAAWFAWQGEPLLHVESVSSEIYSGELWLVTLEYDQSASREIYAFELERRTVRAY